ncbi:MAG TPA: hypothetical protein DCQ28_15015 [Bacteroidetes bacterium]|nr:hypothetical protein [Bacteroidota bacterium]
MKKFYFNTFFLLLFVGGLTMANAAMQNSDTEENVNYKWSFVAKVGTGEGRRLSTITRDTILHSGEEFKMMVNLLKKSYVYVIHKSSTSELSVLYPYSFDAPMELEKNFYIPKGRSWFKLDKNTGDETFYILASQERLTDLENRLRQYSDAAQTNKKDLVAGIITDIKEIKKKYRTYSTLAERPISIAGNVRGTKTDAVDIDRIDIATLATEISANNFYSKTITIEHK